VRIWKESAVAYLKVLKKTKEDLSHDSQQPTHLNIVMWGEEPNEYLEYRRYTVKVNVLIDLRNTEMTGTFLLTYTYTHTYK